MKIGLLAFWDLPSFSHSSNSRVEKQRLELGYVRRVRARNAGVRGNYTEACLVK